MQLQGSAPEGFVAERVVTEDALPADEDGTVGLGVSRVGDSPWRLRLRTRDGGERPYGKNDADVDGQHDSGEHRHPAEYLPDQVQTATSLHASLEVIVGRSCRGAM